MIHTLAMDTGGGGNVGTAAGRRLLAVLEVVSLLLVGILLAFQTLRKKLFNPKVNIKGKVVLITSGDGVFGRELALQFADQGCKVASVVPTGSKPEVDDQCTNSAVKTFTSDCHSHSEVADLAGDVHAEFGPIDILVVNNADVKPTGGINEIAQLVNGNLMTSLFLLESFLPDLAQGQNGHIVSVRPLDMGRDAFGGTRGALVDLVDTLSQQMSTGGGGSVYVTLGRLRNKHCARRTTLAAQALVRGVRQRAPTITLPPMHLHYAETFRETVSSVKHAAIEMINRRIKMIT